MNPIHDWVDRVTEGGAGGFVSIAICLFFDETRLGAIDEGKLEQDSEGVAE